jgi:hypothetical protein
MGVAIRRLDLRFDLPDPERPNYPIVTILIDGEDILGGARRGDFIGFDPADILGPESPLPPTEPPRRVAAYRCNCGEPGCGVAAPVIEERNGRILWSDFRDFTGVFVGPTVDEPVEHDGKHLPLPDLAFDAAQYRAEVARASSDDSWETPARKTARLLRQHLEEEDAALKRAGYERGWVAPDWEDPDAFQVSFIDPNGQTVVKVRPAPGRPEDQAIEMAETLLRAPPQAWNVVARNLWPRQQSEREPV